MLKHYCCFQNHAGRLEKLARNSTDFKMPVGIVCQYFRVVIFM